MDLIGQLIQAKKTQTSFPLNDYLKELVKYDKLSRSDKFKHITESPVLQKQLPLCWTAFNGDAQSYFILNEASTIMQTIANHPLDIFTDLAQTYSVRKRRQMEIIGNVMHHRFNYFQLSQLSPTFDFSKAIYLTEKGDDENEIRISVIWTQTINNVGITQVYSGLINLSGVSKVSDGQLVIEPYVKKQDGDFVRIQTYSVQGNNDYAFAETTHYDVSMPDSKTFRYQPKPISINTKSIQGPWKEVILSPEDETLLNIQKDDIDVMGTLILKYLPEYEAPSMIDRMNALKKADETEAEHETK